LTKILKRVRLYKVGDHRSSSFSGGMKRRLSVGISCIGNPQVIFMDEPTTGMDPMSRRHVWGLIQDLKKDRIVILTTHSMEEADVLGDKIAIMSKGRLRCIGNSLHLKNKFGEGYRINIVARGLESVEETKQIVQKYLPGAIIVAETGENLIYSLSSSNEVRLIIPFFKKLESMMVPGQGSPVKDWAVSHTTLEEVFLKVTREVAAHSHQEGDNVAANQWQQNPAPKMNGSAIIH